MQFELKLKYNVLGLQLSGARPYRRRSPAPSRDRHHLGESLDFILFLTYLYGLDA